MCVAVESDAGAGEGVLFVSPQVVLHKDIEDDRKNEDGDEEVELVGDTRKAAHDEGCCGANALKHAEDLEGHVVVVGTTQINQACVVWCGVVWRVVVWWGVVWCGVA